MAIMGPSGSGKRTLLTIAGSLAEPTSGEVVVDGASLSTMSRREQARLRRRSIGYVFQEFNLLAGLTAVENVALPLELDGTPARAARTVALAALDDLGLSDRADGYPDDLSGGERQRVAIARAVVGDRRLMLADEPTGALDTVNGEAVMRLLRAACHRGRRGGRHGLLGVALGALGAYLALASGYARDLGVLGDVPVTELAVLAAGIPVLAAGAGWALGGREPSSLVRRET